MFDINRITHCENTFPQSFSRVARREYGLLYYQPQNPDSHDSNHAVILDLAVDLEAAVDDLTSFYGVLGVSPRLYQGFVHGERQALFPLLEHRGFRIIHEDTRFYGLKEPSTISPCQELVTRRARTLGPAIADIVRAENKGKGDWTLGVIRYQLARDQYHLLVAYDGETPVSMAALDIMDGLSRVDEVVTHPHYRRRGYGRSLIHRLVQYHGQISDNALYLYADNPVAQRIYLEAGFREIEWDFCRWSAWIPGDGGGPPALDQEAHPTDKQESGSGSA